MDGIVTPEAVVLDVDTAGVASRVFAGSAPILAIPGLVAYVDAAFVHLDAQGGLVFVFAPLLQWAAVVALGVACALLRAWKPDGR